MRLKRPLLVLTGPTAVGKSAVAARVAQLIGAEIICGDSRQLYRGIPVGSAMPSPGESAMAPHHLFGILDPSAPSSVGIWRELASEAIEGILERGRLPLVVGGTGLYLRVLTGGQGIAPPAARGIIDRLSARLHTEGAEALWNELRARDPESAGRIALGDTYRIVRALAVLDQTGKPRGVFGAGSPPPWKPVAQVALRRPRTELAARIDARAKAMLGGGMVEEAVALRSAGLGPDHPVMTAIGYRHCLAMVDGAIDRAKALELLRRDSRRYAKRQMTWLRSRKEVSWIDARDPDGTAAEVSQRFRMMIG